MITSAVVNYVASVMPDLTKSVDLFTEQANGSKYVLLKNASTKPDEIYEVRQTMIQVTVFGYGVEEGDDLAKRVVDSLNALVGEIVANTGERYVVMSTDVLALPTLANINNANVYSATVNVSYRTE